MTPAPTMSSEKVREISIIKGLIIVSSTANTTIIAQQIIVAILLFNIFYPFSNN
jgi:hypothetical protein